MEALRTFVESQLDPKPKSYSIQYRDGQNDVINVSDDEDLHTAYEVAHKELQGNLKLNVTVKPESQPSVSTGTEEEKKETKKTPKEKKPAKKTVRKSSKKKSKKNAATDLLFEGGDSSSDDKDEETLPEYVD